VRREAVASSRIEGTITDLRQLVLFEADPETGLRARDPEWADRQEVVNYVHAMNHGLKRLTEMPLTLRLMREVHARLMEGVRGQDKRPGEFRDRQNMIGRDGQHPSDSRFVPPPVAEMTEAMYDLEKYIHQASGLPLLVDLALIHYQFEAIHPFLDGNGRLGRLLIPFLLCWKGLLAQPLLYLSDYLEAHRGEYTDRLLAVSQRGEWTGWIDFFLRGVALQSRRALRRCQELLKLREQSRTLAATVGSSARLLQLVDLLFEHPAITITRAAEALGVTFPSAQQSVEKLVQVGILVEATGKARNRIYVAHHILDTIEAPEDDHTD
jgi:Fic family protein